MQTSRINVSQFRLALDQNYVLLLTSNSVEKAAVDNIIEKRTRAFFENSDRGCSIGFIGDRIVLHVTGESGGSRDKSIGRIARRLLIDTNMPKPCFVVLVGFCWGNPNDTKIGDVILTDTVYSLNRQRFEREGVNRLKLTCQNTLQIDSDMLGEINVSLAGYRINVISGPIASLETYFVSDEMRDELLKEHPEVIGGEMEGYDFLPDCDQIPWIVSKAVSDFAGDDVNRDKQYLAAQGAVRVIPALLSQLQHRDQLPNLLNSPTFDSLVDALNGNTLVVNVGDAPTDELNDYLNDVIGPALDYKLQQYSSPLEFGTKFAKYFCDLILEIMQNALRHGKANKAEVSFTDSKIIVCDDGDHFDLKLIEGERGGAIAWRAINKLFLESSDVEFDIQKLNNPPGNKYVFFLNKIDVILQKAIENCTATVSPGTIGAAMGRQVVLDVDQDCEAIYFDTSPIRMTSRRLEITDAVRKFTEAGKLVYIGCNSQDEIDKYKEMLADIDGDQVKFFIENRR